MRLKCRSGSHISNLERMSDDNCQLVWGAILTQQASSSIKYLSRQASWRLICDQNSCAPGMSWWRFWDGWICSWFGKSINNWLLLRRWALERLSVCNKEPRLSSLPVDGLLIAFLPASWKEPGQLPNVERVPGENGSNRLKLPRSDRSFVRILFGVEANGLLAW